VIAPFVIREWAASVPVRLISRVTGYWSKIRFDGSQASRYRPALRSERPKVHRTFGPADHWSTGG
jgi:hypothetical protein